VIFGFSRERVEKVVWNRVDKRQSLHNMLMIFVLLLVLVPVLGIDCNGTALSEEQKRGTCPWLVRNLLYTGGSSKLFVAGDLSPDGSLKPAKIPPPSSAFPGEWKDEVYEYHYTVQPTKNRYCEVKCYCMIGVLCSCEKTDDLAYFSDLIENGPANRVNVLSASGGVSHFLINGTLDFPAQDAILRGLPFNRSPSLYAPSMAPMTTASISMAILFILLLMLII
jgi:hypothetical protein